jgi:hypothetical protein
MVSRFQSRQGGLQELQKIEGDLEVVIIRDIKSSKFRVFGPEDRFLPACEDLDQLLQEIQPCSTGHNAEHPRTTNAAEGDCAVCLCEADQALTLSCGHVYCTICFVNMCLVEASMFGDFSIKCVADKGNCKKAIPLLEIQHLLLSEIFENVLEASFASSCVDTKTSSATVQHPNALKSTALLNRKQASRQSSHGLKA